MTKNKRFYIGNRNRENDGQGAVYTSFRCFKDDFLDRFNGLCNLDEIAKGNESGFSDDGCSQVKVFFSEEEAIKWVCECPSFTKEEYEYELKLLKENMSKTRAQLLKELEEKGLKMHVPKPDLQNYVAFVDIDSFNANKKKNTRNTTTLNKTASRIIIKGKDWKRSDMIKKLRRGVTYIGYVFRTEDAARKFVGK